MKSKDVLTDFFDELDSIDKSDTESVWNRVYNSVNESDDPHTQAKLIEARQVAMAKLNKNTKVMSALNETAMLMSKVTVKASQEAQLEAYNADVSKMEKEEIYPAKFAEYATKYWKQYDIENKMKAVEELAAEEGLK